MAEASDAPQKIELTYARDGVEITSQAKEHMRHVVDVFGSDSGVKRWLLAPNYSHANANDPPTGGVIVFAADAPMFPDAFSTENLMTAGTSFVRISVTNDGQPVTDAYLKRPEVMEAMARVAASVAECPDAIGMDCRDTKTNNDTRTWRPALGGTGGYAGLFRASVESELSNHDVYYLGVRSSAPRVSRDLVEWLTKRKEELSRGNTTSTDIKASEFAGSRHVSYAQEAGRRNRNRMLAEIANAINVKVPTRQDSACYLSESQLASGVRRSRVVVPHIENPAHVVRHMPSDNPAEDVVIYYNNTTPTNLKIEGVVVSQSARLGPILHRSHRMAGGYVGWSNDSSFSAYPVDTGRRENTRDLAKKRDAPSQRDQIFTWAGKQNWNAQLVPGYYNQADQSFLDGIQKLGRPAELETQRLKPIFVVLVPTRKPAVASSAYAASPAAAASSSSSSSSSNAQK